MSNLEYFDLSDISSEELLRLPVENSKSRLFCGILYPSDESQHYAINALAMGLYKSVAIIHDKCKNEDGTSKKVHLHFIIKFPNARYLESLARELRIAPNYLRSCNSFKSYSAYLLHLSEPFKYQYSVTEVYGSLYQEFLKAVNSIDDESIKVQKILNYIASCSKYTKTVTYLNYVCENGLYDTWRRGYSIFRDIIYEKRGI